MRLKLAALAQSLFCVSTALASGGLNHYEQELSALDLHYQANAQSLGRQRQAMGCQPKASTEDPAVKPVNIEKTLRVNGTIRVEYEPNNKHPNRYPDYFSTMSSVMSEGNPLLHSHYKTMSQYLDNPNMGVYIQSCVDRQNYYDLLNAEKNRALAEARVTNMADHFRAHGVHEKRICTVAQVRDCATSNDQVRIGSYVLDMKVYGEMPKALVEGPKILKPLKLSKSASAPEVSEP